MKSPLKADIYKNEISTQQSDQKGSATSSYYSERYVPRYFLAQSIYLSEGIVYMEYDFSTLIVLAEVTIAFVAFSSIVATIKLTIGDELNKFQRLLIHFFTESGMLSVSVCLFPLVLWEFWPNEAIVAQLVSAYTLLMTLPYLIWYIRRRLKVNYPTPLSSKVVIAGYFIWMPVLLINATGLVWSPSISAITGITFWALITSAVVFVTFLSTFVDKSAISVSMETNEVPKQ